MFILFCFLNFARPALQQNMVWWPLWILRNYALRIGDWRPANYVYPYLTICLVYSNVQIAIQRRLSQKPRPFRTAGYWEGCCWCASNAACGESAMCAPGASIEPQEACRVCLLCYNEQKYRWNNTRIKKTLCAISGSWKQAERWPIATTFCKIQG